MHTAVSLRTMIQCSLCKSVLETSSSRRLLDHQSVDRIQVLAETRVTVEEQIKSRRRAPGSSPLAALYASAPVSFVHTPTMYTVLYIYIL